MQAEWKGKFLYIYSGRDIQCRNPDVEQVGKEDPFSKVHCIHVDSITSVEVDHKEFTVKLYIQGHQYPLFCTFGDRNCYKINCHAAFVSVLMQALHMDSESIWDLNRRNEQTALSSQRKDEMEVE